MTIAVLAGIGIGLGLLGVLFGLRPRPRLVGAVLRDLDSPRPFPEPASPRRRAQRALRPDHALGARLSSFLETRGWVSDRVRLLARSGDLTVEELCGQSLLGGFAGLVLPPLTAAVAASGGVRTPILVPAWSSLVVGAAGAALPLLVLRHGAARTRRAARTVVAGYLDLVVLCLAGGMGIEGALQAAAAVGDDPYSSMIASALERARDAGDTPWAALAAVGRELGVVDLVELAAAVHLAGTEGAKVRSTLAAKAASIRRHELAEAEAEANAVTERLFLPGALLLVGFLLFLGYPAVARITGGL